MHRALCIVHRASQMVHMQHIAADADLETTKRIWYELRIL